MQKYWILSIFLVLFSDVVFGFGLTMGYGLSAKNIYLYLSLMAIIVGAVLSGRANDINLLGVHIPFILLILLAMLSTVVVSLAVDPPGYDVTASIIKVKGTIADHYLFFLVFCYGITSSRDALWIMKAMIVFIVLSSIMSLLDYYNIPDFGLIGVENGRIEGPMGEANQYAAFLLFILALTLAWASTETGLKRVLLYLGAGLNFLLIILTGSRGGYLGMVVGSIAMTWALRDIVDMRKVAAYAFAAIAAAALFVILIMLIDPDMLLQRFETSSADDLRSASSGRSENWTIAMLEMFKAPWSLIVGFGWDMYLQFPFPVLDAHNTYLQLLFELGIVGLGLWLTVWCSLFSLLRHAARTASEPNSVFYTGACYALAPLSIAVIFVMLFGAWQIIWAIMGLLARLALSEEAPLPSAEVTRERAPMHGVGSGSGLTEAT